jgi:acetyl esterase/lipase
MKSRVGLFKVLPVVLLALPGAAAAADANKPREYVPPDFERPPAVIAGATRHVFKEVNGFSLPLYVFAPPETFPRPAAAVVFFHGSGWHSGTLMQFVAHARRLASLGMCTAVAEYRVKVFYDATPFDCLADAKSAIRWLRANSATLGIDPKRVAAAGGSAGAHIALGSAVFDGLFDDPADDPRISARPDLVVLFAAATDTTKRDDESAPNPLFLGRERELSPIHHLPRGMPPVQIFHGVEDPWTKMARVQVLADAMKANGDECDLVPFEGRSHFFYNHPDYYTRYPDFAPVRGVDDFELCVLLMTRFLYVHGFLPERPRVH